MKKLLTLTFAPVPVFSPATASWKAAKARAVASEVAVLGHTGPNGAQTYTEPDSNNPDSLNDVGAVPGLAWDFNNALADYWVLNVKANLDNEVSSTCAKLFPKQVTRRWWGRATPLGRAVRATRLARAE